MLSRTMGISLFSLIDPTNSTVRLYDGWKYGQKQDEKKIQSQVSSIHKTLGSKPNTTIKKSTTVSVNEEMKERSKDLFSELFGDKK